jgi:hypothetical protein
MRLRLQGEPLARLPRQRAWRPARLAVRIAVPSSYFSDRVNHRVRGREYRSKRRIEPLKPDTFGFGLDGYPGDGARKGALSGSRTK